MAKNKLLLIFIVLALLFIILSLGFFLYQKSQKLTIVGVAPPPLTYNDVRDKIDETQKVLKTAESIKSNALDSSDIKVVQCAGSVYCSSEYQAQLVIHLIDVKNKLIEKGQYDVEKNKLDGRFSGAESYLNEAENLLKKGDLYGSFNSAISVNSNIDAGLQQFLHSIREPLEGPLPLK